MELRDFESRIHRPERYLRRSTNLKACVTAISDFEEAPNQLLLDRVKRTLEIWKSGDPKEYNARGKPIEKDLQVAVRKAFWRFRPGEIEVIDPLAHPVFGDDRWRSNAVIGSTNCYAYACDDPDRHSPGSMQDPGLLFDSQQRSANRSRLRSVSNELSGNDELSGLRERSASDSLSAADEPSSLNELSALNEFSAANERSQSLIVWRDPEAQISEQGTKWNEAIKADNLMRRQLSQKELEAYEGEAGDVFNKPGYYLIALFVSCGDYHWYRQDRSGQWSHERGHLPPTNLDDHGSLITNPREAATGAYRFSKFYYVPKGGIRTVPDALQRNASGIIAPGKR